MNCYSLQGFSLRSYPQTSPKKRQGNRPAFSYARKTKKPTSLVYPHEVEKISAAWLSPVCGERLSPFLDSILLCVPGSLKVALELICFAIEYRLTYRHARICFAYAVGMGNFPFNFRNCSLVSKGRKLYLDHSFAVAFLGKRKR